ncbi:MAG: peptide chain release factor 2 [Acidimicrobiia bacterium]|nr:peptide chain release factor 2 [Acidimicrobiia bacterium]
MNDVDPRALLKELRLRLDDARRFLDVEARTAELDELRELASAPDLWDDQDRALEITRKLARGEQIVTQVETLTMSLDDAEVLLELVEEEDDAEARRDVIAEMEETESVLKALERETLFFGDYDDRTAIVSIHAGAGGVDAQDWAEMLLRMYVRWLERSSMSFEIDEILPGDEAGIKSATLTVRGDHAYGLFESERGVHRLVRISPFDANARRHTSFAGVDVIPEVEVNEVEINQEDLKIDTFRSSGAGGQHVNVTDSAVRITHLPTGTVVSCQAERSQMQNKARAMVLLAARLAELARQDQLAKVDAIRGEQTEAGWGRQIRSYVLQPYQMVKDLRTGAEIGNVQGVLDGDIDRLIDEYLIWRRTEQGT